MLKSYLVTLLSLKACLINFKWNNTLWWLRASINFHIQEVQTSYLWNLEVPLIFYGSPSFFWDMVAVWRIVKLALKNKHIYFRDKFFFVPYNAFLFPGVLLWGSSSQCHGFVYSLWLWYFLIIRTIFDAHVVCSWTAVCQLSIGFSSI